MPINEQDITWDDNNAPQDVTWDDEQQQGTMEYLGKSAVSPLMRMLGMAATTMQKALGDEEASYMDVLKQTEQMKGKAPSTEAKYVGAGVEGVTDPLSYAIGPTGLAAKVATGFAGGFGGEAGADVGGSVEKALTGEETIVGRGLGGLAGGISASATATPTRALTQTGLDYTKQIWNKYKTVAANPEAAADAVAAGSTKRFLEKAAGASTAEDLVNALSEFNDAYMFVTKADAPLAFAMSDNPSIRGQLINLAKSSPEGRKRLEQEVNKIAKAIDEKSAKIFGGTKGVSDVGIKLTPIQKRINNIEKSLESVRKRFPEGASQEEMSGVVEKLVEQQKKAVSDALSEKYDALKTAARQEGVTVPSEGTRDLYTFFKSNRLADLFGIGSETERAVRSKLAPKVNEKNLEEFREMSFDTVDSLKRLINREQRLSKDPAKLDKLRQFEQALDDVRETYIPEFSQRLREIDAEYFERMGVPFRNAQLIKEIDSAKYASEIAPKIVKNIDGYRQFINASGEQGQQVAKNAMLAKAYQSSLTNGQFNPSKLQAFLKNPQNKLILDEMPDVKKQIEDGLLDFNVLRTQKAQMDVMAKQARQELANNTLLRLDESSYTSLVDSVLNSTSKRASLQKQLGQLSSENAKAVRESMRSALAQKALNFPGGAVAFLESPKNAAGVKLIMGDQYLQALKKIAIVSDHIKKIGNLDNIVLNASQEQYDVLARVGLDTPFVVSTLRDRIASNVQKAVRLASRVNVKQSQDKFEQNVIDVLFDPQAVKAMAKVSSDLNFKLNTPQALRKFSQTFLEAMPASAYLGTIQGMQEEQQ